MALFQKSVLKKHILDLDTAVVDAAYQRYTAYFHNATIQQNIRNAKEEQFQEGFLRELFGAVLNYTLNPQPNFNLTTELKNTTNSKKADGAILVNDKAVAVIELKGTETTDLTKIESQAFGYKNNQAECNYVITSNFEKLRFYIDNTIDYEEFNLFTLTRDQFSLLYLCLSYDNLKNNVPKRLKAESVSQEDQISKKLYKDYSEFKRALYNNLVELNPQFDKLLLFKKTQKLLDRFLFIFFAEDTNLLPTNLIFRINKEWKNLQEMRIPVSLYERYLLYFNDLNHGAKVTLPAFGNKTGEAITAEFEIFAYNGGLFQTDEILDNVKIDDKLLHTYSEKLSHYDFDSDVDVNILGHIFENSLNEIDEIKSEIEGTAVDKTKTKRKKDGVFYTPKYITKYIVDNTVGKLCTEKKAEMKLADEDYTSDKKVQTKTKKALLDKLTEYREWMLQLTICDPACGSGAFLNQALEFLIAEHRYVDELQAKLMGDALILSDIETSILENNIYGVDLNDESVEIAKLSLWLRTAQKGRKLNSLNNNIKCGNSLIDDPEVAGNKAFSWEKEFPEVFKEKNKFAFHITTALHDSRTSERMVKYKVRERRFEGTKPDPEVFPMTKEEEELIATTVAEIAKEDKLNIAAFNLCWDHMHILLVCEEEEVPKIMHKIKGRTARACNALRNKGINPLDTLRKDGSIPFWTQKYGCKPITSDEHFWNAYNYIENNKVKHNLPKNPKLEKIILGFVKSYEDCFKTEYKGGFDVVIGNPPYVQLQSMGEISKGIEKMNYISFEKAGDLYCLFYELGNDILKEFGLLGYITSNKWLRANYGKSLRNYLIENTQPLELIDLGSGIFESATVDSNILIFCKTQKNRKSFFGLDISKEKTFVDFSKFENKKVKIDIIKDRVWSISSTTEQNLKAKVDRKGIPLKDWNIEIKYGIKTGLNEAFIIDNFKRDELISEDPKSEEIIVPVLRGRDVNKYQVDYQDLYLINTHNGFKNQNRIEVDNYRAVKKYLAQFEPQLSNRYDKGETPYNLRNCAYLNAFQETKIIWKEMSSEPPFVIDKEGYYTNDTITFIVGENLEYILALLNSKLIFHIYSNYYSGGGLGSTGIRFKKEFLSELPIISVSKNQQRPIVDKTNLMLSLNKDFQTQTQKLSTYICSQYHLEKLSGKLTNWYELDFSDFIKELNKAIKAVKGTPLSKKDEFEWMELFEENKQKALALKAEIDRTDKEIDQMVYELYGLTEEEIRIVEGV